MPGTNQLAELRVSNDILGDPSELRRRFDEEGYVFIKGVFDRNDMLNLRREMMTTIQQGGWLAAETDPLEGIAELSARCTEGDPGYTDVYFEVYKVEDFHRIAHSPGVMEIVEKLIGRAAIPIPQKIARIWFPQFTMHTTPIHQDFVHFQGNFETYTAWSPVGDCPIELGGLALLPGSHKIGRVLEHHFSLGAGSLSLVFTLIQAGGCYIVAANQIFSAHDPWPVWLPTCVCGCMQLSIFSLAFYPRGCRDECGRGDAADGATDGGDEWRSVSLPRFVSGSRHDRHDRSVTRGVGTTLYMSPEHISGAPFDTNADICKSPAFRTLAGRCLSSAH